jgi:hypothetical protein
MAISGPPAPAAAVAAVGEEDQGREDAADDADAISNVPSREARQEMIKAVRATFDRIHVLSSMDDELKRLLIKEFRVVSKAHGEAIATKGEPSTRFYIVHRCRPLMPTPPSTPVLCCGWQLRSSRAWNPRAAQCGCSGQHVTADT